MADTFTRRAVNRALLVLAVGLATDGARPPALVGADAVLHRRG